MQCWCWCWSCFSLWRLAVGMCVCVYVYVCTCIPGQPQLLRVSAMAARQRPASQVCKLATAAHARTSREHHGMHTDTAQGAAAGSRVRLAVNRRVWHGGLARAALYAGASR